MMLKWTKKWAFPLLMVVLGCQNQHDAELYQQRFRQKVDAAAEARIDSAYAAIGQRCDSLLVHQVPLWADSISKALDSAGQLKTPSHAQ